MQACVFQPHGRISLGNQCHIIEGGGYAFLIEPITQSGRIGDLALLTPHVSNIIHILLFVCVI